MKLKFLTLMVFLTFSCLSFGAERGFKTTWYCPSDNRGEMPEEKQIRVTYNKKGELVFKPNIFRMQNVGGLFRRLFGGGREGTGLGGCLKSFMENLSEPLKEYRLTNCYRSVGALCEKSPSQIAADVGSSIKRSVFYKKYQPSLVIAENSLNPEIVSIPEVKLEEPQIPTIVAPTPGPTNLVPQADPVPRRESLPERVLGGITSIFNRPSRISAPQSDEDARAKLLDLMIDNANLLSAPETRKFSELCPDLGETQGVNTAWCQHQYDRRHRVLSKMAQLLSSISGIPVSPRKALSAVACFESRNDFDSIEELLKAVEAKDDCEEINPGDYKSGPYLLRRLSDGNYEATVVTDFTYQSGTLNPAQAKARINKCFTDLAPYMKGPGGETLKINILSSEEAKSELQSYERTPARKINLLAHQRDIGGGVVEDVRGNTANFHDGMGCSTFVHEYLHHLGLWDEYHEKSTQIQAGQTKSMEALAACRVVPKKNTIMNSNYQAVMDTVPMRMACKCSNDNCRRSFRSITPATNYITDLLSSMSPNEMMSASLRSKCVSTFITNDAVNLQLPSRRSIIESQSEGKLVFEFRLVQLDNLSSSGLPSVSRLKQTCSCQGDASCAEELKGFAEKINQNQPTAFCPLGTVIAGNGIVNEAEIAVGEESRIEGDVLQVVSRPISQESLLAPNHFNKILYRNCKEGPVADYNTCSSFAYLPLDDPKCAAKPAECSSDEHYLGFGSAR